MRVYSDVSAIYSDVSAAICWSMCCSVSSFAFSGSSASLLERDETDDRPAPLMSVDCMTAPKLSSFDHAASDTRMKAMTSPSMRTM
jgi:hypothetical protein